MEITLQSSDAIGMESEIENEINRSATAFAFTIAAIFKTIAMLERGRRRNRSR